MLNIRRNVGFGFVEVCSTILLTFLSYRLVIAHGGVSLLGVWSTLFAWFFLARLGDLGIGGAVTRYVSPMDPKLDRDRIRHIFATAILINAVVLTILAILSYFAIRYWIASIVGPDFVAVALPALPWIVAYIIISNMGLVVMNSLTALHIGFARSIIMIFANALQLGLAFLLVPKYGLIGFAQAQIAQYGLAMIVAWLVVCRTLGHFSLPTQFRLGVLKDILGFSLTLQFSNLLNGLFEPAAKVLVGSFGGMHMLGIYETAWKTIFTIRNVAANTAGAIIPSLTRLVQSDLTQARDLYTVSRRRTFRLLSALFASMLIASPLISWLWLGSVDSLFIAVFAQLWVGILVSGWATPAYYLGLASGSFRGIIFSVSSALLCLCVLGLAAGLAKQPILIVAAASLSLVVSNVLVMLLNEPLIGLRNRLSGIANRGL